jgi:hypothetical protein
VSQLPLFYHYKWLTGIRKRYLGAKVCLTSKHRYNLRYRVSRFLPAPKHTSTVSELHTALRTFGLVCKLVCCFFKLVLLCKLHMRKIQVNCINISIKQNSHINVCAFNMFLVRHSNFMHKKTQYLVTLLRKCNCQFY